MIIQEERKLFFQITTKDSHYWQNGLYNKFCKTQTKIVLTRNG